MTSSTTAADTPVPPEALNVLLIDDDSFQLEMLTEILESLGVRTIATAANGAQALQLLAGHHNVNLMLLDLHMPDMDGFQFMHALANTGYSGALIIVSGQSYDVMDAAVLVAKLRRFTLLGTVSKPVGVAALSKLLAKLR